MDEEMIADHALVCCSLNQLSTNPNTRLTESTASMSDHEEQWWLFEPIEIDDDPNEVIFSSDDDSFWDTSDSESESDDDSFDDDSSTHGSSDDDCSDDDCSDDDCSDDDCSDDDCSDDDCSDENFNPDKALKAGYKKCLQAHNEKRNLHEDTPPMKLDKILCSQAQEGAEDLGKRNAFAHDTPRYGAGENLFMTSAGKNEDGLSKERCVSFGQSSVNAWYGEIDNYSFSKHGKKNDGVIGHFTQLVWKKSVKLGVGIAKRKDGKTIVLCRYSPAGNMNMSKNLPDQIGDLKCKNC
ncbi:Oidioi.mRNA.OKI2018_I69.chr2.g8259.t1.cds [Oikopleura dioica]|uniref:Oidioi.mRNA.OKI2018_I69.chr2.g8259.t1.cds n=1 Tax=Oikopleura dioica TaxID=34765 RepID=A0ABN7TAY9_OIKDI|nr:Oidioi.mRNA.OKI2018_I69.chr2.g8259.t1.cds [Oikopleura dioica]